MNFPIIPSGLLGPEGALLTALFIGALFGFALERSGFGNSKKLAAQFYLYDMTVFKVMFTAILVSMTGLFALSHLGIVNIDMVWINPTYFWPQLVGGFMLGVGFLVSGFCPGTSFVAMVSGKLDGIVTIIGVAIGILIFAISIDAIPFLMNLYSVPSAGVKLLPDMVGLSAPWVAMGITIMALGAFIGAEKVEGIFHKKYEAQGLETVPSVSDKKGVKYYLFGLLAIVSLLTALQDPGVASADVSQGSISIDRVQPLELAEVIITRDPLLILLDIRETIESDAIKIPGALLMESSGDYILDMLESLPVESRVVLIGSRRTKVAVPEGFPLNRSYQWLSGGVEGWESEVLKPSNARDSSLAELDKTRRQNQIAAFFSGAKVEISTAPPPPTVSGGKKKKRATGGC
jgi:uncharacterized membrane protein YedE/YeeE